MEAEDVDGQAGAGVEAEDVDEWAGAGVEADDVDGREGADVEAEVVEEMEVDAGADDGDGTTSDGGTSTSEEEDFGGGRRRGHAGRGRAGAGRGRAGAGRAGVGRAGAGRGGRGRAAQGRQAAGGHQFPAPGNGAFGYDDVDEPNTDIPFQPSRPPGFCMAAPVLRNHMTRAIDFFYLFFIVELFQQIAEFTSLYAFTKVADEHKKTYVEADGSWLATTPDEIQKLVGMILYFGLVMVSSFDRYWSTHTVYHGLWARAIMTRRRFRALMGMLHVVHPGLEVANNKLRKVRSLVNHFKDRFRSLYEPFRKVAVDERMVNLGIQVVYT